MTQIYPQEQPRTHEQEQEQEQGLQQGQDDVTEAEQFQLADAVAASEVPSSMVFATEDDEVRRSGHDDGGEQGVEETIGISPTTVAGPSLSPPAPHTVPTVLRDSAIGPARAFDLDRAQQSLSLVNAASSTGFTAARLGTHFGLRLARGVTSALIQAPFAFADHTFGLASTDSSLGGGPSSSAMRKAVGGLFDAVDFLALGSIDLAASLTSGGLTAASSGVEGLRRLLGSEVLKSLSTFGALVKREWNPDSPDLPPGGLPAYSTFTVTRAIVAWVAVQLVTRRYTEEKMLRQLDEVSLSPPSAAAADAGEPAQGGTAPGRGLAPTSPPPSQTGSVRITREEHLPADEGDIIDAEISASSEPAPPESTSVSGRGQSTTSVRPAGPLTVSQAIGRFKQYSKLVLGVYGGVGLLFFGVPLPTLVDWLDSADSQAQAATPASMASRLSSGTGASHEPATAITEAEASQEGPPAVSARADEREFLDALACAPRRRTSRGAMPGAYPGWEEERDEEAGGAVLVQAEAERDGQAPVEAPDTAEPTAAPVDATTSPATASPRDGPSPGQGSTTYSFLDLLRGRHDDDLLHRLGGLESGAAHAGSYDDARMERVLLRRGAEEREGPPGAEKGGHGGRREVREGREGTVAPSRPRYYVVTDHARRTIVLVLRGTMSLGDLAVDLTCESVPMEEQGRRNRHSRTANTRSGRDEAAGGAGVSLGKEEEQLVHEGIYATAREIGGRRRPVTRAVARALMKNEGYGLEIVGHSLGAGLAALLALMWADPETQLTTRSSGLPAGKPVHAWCFAPPCVTTQNLSARSRGLITSFVYSYDVVSRLSLGAVLDIRNACAWLCFEDRQSETRSSGGSAAENQENQTGGSDGDAAGPSNSVRMTDLTTRAFQYLGGQLDGQGMWDRKRNEEQWFVSVRKRLEANMRSTHLFPPGDIFLLLEPQDLQASLSGVATSPSSGGTTGTRQAEAGRRLFRVREGADLRDVFGQIVFSTNMLSCHLPHRYDVAVDDVPLA